MEEGPLSALLFSDSSSMKLLICIFTDPLHPSELIQGRCF